VPFDLVFFLFSLRPAHVAPYQDDSVLKTVATTLAQVKSAASSEQDWLSLRDKFFPQ
jgi:hypothetical protein